MSHPPLREPFQPPAELDGCRVGALLGEGASGRVYSAYDPVLDRDVAIKFLAEAAADQAARERFTAEARALARLQHPNVVAIYRVGEADGHPYLVSELVRGTSLDRLPRPVPPERAAAIGLGLARGLAEAHRRGVLHRDVKPANAVLDEDGNAKLVDFGLAQVLERDGARRAGSPAVDGAGAYGTPLYAAPEIWRGDPATARSDVYSLGALLFDLVAGRPPHLAGDGRALGAAVEGTDAPPLGSVAPRADERLAAIVDRCLRREPALRFADAGEVRDALSALAEAIRGAPPLPEGNVYRGLQPFDAEHRRVFFGRDAEARALLERLRRESLVLVCGPSGVGKSSLCRAGVAARVLEGALGADRRWSAAALVPGAHPLHALAGALAPHLGAPAAELAGRLERGDPLPAPGEQGVLVLADQLEELITLASRADAERAAEALVALAGMPGVKVLATVRGDYFTAIAALPALEARASAAFHLLRPLSARGMRECVLGPARARGVAFESEAMVDELVEATARADGGLPLLQFTLALLWEGRDETRQLIPRDVLQRLGGVTGALAKHADGVWQALTLSRRAAARRILCALVTPELTRARSAAGELVGGDPESKAALDALVQGRLVVARDSGEGAEYELIHEVLIRGWPALGGWLRDDAGSRPARERVARAALEWERLARSKGALWSAAQLDDVGRLPAESLHPREQAFLEESRRVARRARLLRRAALPALAAVVAVAYGTAQLQDRRARAREVAVHRVRAAESLRAAVEANAAVERLQAGAFAAFDGRDRANGESLWAEALKGEGVVWDALARAAGSLEAAIAVDPGAREARDELGELCLLAARLAERDHHPRERDEWLQRLALYDATGERRARWTAPVEVALAVEPADAALSLEVYGPDGQPRPVELPRPPAPSLTPGSYRLTARAPGRADVLFPFWISRVSPPGLLHLRLPDASRVPAGFAYVPKGRSWFGTSNEEQRAPFFDTAPLHPVETGAFLIQRTEVTVAEWILFLDALPPAERARRLPHAGSAGAKHGSLSLVPLGGGRWRYELQPASLRYAAESGQPLVISGRTRRASQDWSRFPVSGVSVEDAEAYARWLDSTGRVPGARLCDEREWERAARGADLRELPGGAELEPDAANFDLTYGRSPGAFGPDEVGSHPRSRSPFGVDDLAGNVWEFVRPSLTGARAMLRGGSYYYNRVTLRSVNREEIEPSLRDPNAGVRICATPAPE
ncbi:MAG TPA: protein kinase [Myxococcaceae bacterium]|jgi:formylglycine-generating enzyme required for sulfatase activity/tRNA A-37 threonylcarbamoyl transferase component Bud32